VTATSDAADATSAAARRRFAADVALALGVAEQVSRPSGALPAWFSRGEPVVVARAPGRLDVMGGIADYSGSLVLEWPLAEAAVVLAQGSDDGVMRFASVAPAGSRALEAPHPVPRVLTLPRDGFAGDYAAARAWFAEPARHFGAYVAGGGVALQAERLLASGASGLRVLVVSQVPEGEGVSSSAAVTVAALVATAALWGVRASGRDLALLAQRVENLVAGAPSGVMDPMTVVYGEEGRLLELLCQPAEVRGQRAVPDALELFGLDSGVRHAVVGADYRAVRAAAFAGRRLLAARLGPIDYLANVGSARLCAELALLPEELDGAELLRRAGPSDDPATSIEAERRYPVRAATVHPVEEHERVTRFAELLALAPTDAVLEEFGALMAASHASYSACGLGSTATDRLVELVRDEGLAAGLVGAKITGGGGGGTVAVLARRGARPSVERVAARYRAEAGSAPGIFEGSSPGALAFGARRLLFGGEEGKTERIWP
jgi:L-arabinokinase